MSRPVLVEVRSELRLLVVRIMKEIWVTHTKMGTMSQRSKWVESHMEEEVWWTFNSLRRWW